MLHLSTALSSKSIEEHVSCFSCYTSHLGLEAIPANNAVDHALSKNAQIGEESKTEGNPHCEEWGHHPNEIFALEWSGIVMN